METVERKSLLRKSALGFLCINHVQGCSHGCRYPCYAYSMARTYGRAKDYADWCRPKLVANAEELHDEGRTTLVHMEPYPTPNIAGQDLGEILEAVAFVDGIYFGGWNYNAEARDFSGRGDFYRASSAKVRRFCSERGIGITEAGLASPRSGQRRPVCGNGA